MTYLEELKGTIERSERCGAAHVRTVPVKEVFRGQVAWDGDVEVFALTGHARAQRCYSWGYQRRTGPGLEVITVLEIPPVTSPQTAVKAAIVAEAKARVR